MRSQRDAARVLVDGEEAVPVAPCNGVADLGAWGKGRGRFYYNCNKGFITRFYYQGRCSIWKERVLLDRISWLVLQWLGMKR